MRFIVDLYKLLIYVVLALLIIGVAIIVAEMMRAGGPANPAFGAIGVVGAVVTLIIVVLNLGILATFLSIHDRHAEIADTLREMRDDLRSNGNAR